MSEFADMIKEAFLDREKTFDPSPGRQELQAAVDQYSRRMRTVRHMAIFSVGFMSLVAVACAVGFFRAPDDTAIKELLLYAVGFVFAMTAVGWGKMWFSMMQNHLMVVKEVKRVQFMVLEGGEERRG